MAASQPPRSGHELKALVRYDKPAGSVGLMDVPVPKVGDDEVLVEVKFAGVCGTDVHIYHDRYHTTIPLILGHELAGAIVQVGSAVSSWRVGDRVVVENNPHACGKCQACRRGSVNICPEKRAIGFRSDGCFAEYIKVPANVLHRIPEGLSDLAAALAEPTAVAVHATVERGRLESEDVVAVFGPGPIGLISAQTALAMGAKRVTLIGVARDALRLEMAASLGIETVNCQSDDDRWRDVVSGADLIIEASGSPQAIAECFRLVGRVGRVVPVGLIGQERIDIPWNAVMNKETTVAFSYSSKPHNWEMALSLLASGKIAAEKMITAVLPLSEWRQAFSLTEDARAIKVLLLVRVAHLPADPSSE